MGRVEVEAALQAWRKAAHDLEGTSPGSAERSEAENAVVERQRLYQRAVLGGRGRADALDAASETTFDRLAHTRDLIARGHRLTSVGRPPDEHRDPRRDGVEPGASSAGGGEG